MTVAGSGTAAVAITQPESGPPDPMEPGEASGEYARKYVAV